MLIFLAHHTDHKFFHIISRAITLSLSAIIFFSLWRDVSGEMWVLYLGLGTAAALVLSALLLVRLHFCLKSRGYNFLFKCQNNPPPTPLKKDLGKIEESDIHQIDIDVEPNSEKESKVGKDGSVSEEAVTLL